MPKLFVISLGGSLINPGKVSGQFLKNFKNLLLSETKKNNRFILIAGGGKPAREYQEALREITVPSPEDLDWMGIFATRFNANLVRLLFKNKSYKEVVTDFENPKHIKEPIVLAGGWKPGRSSDGAAVRLAELYKADTLINLSNIDYVYTKDPRKFKDAKKIEAISWEEFRKIVGSKWNPGANVPFDPTAAALAEKNKLKVIIANGKNLKNLQNILQEKKFKGTVIT